MRGRRNLKRGAPYRHGQGVCGCVPKQNQIDIFPLENGIQVMLSRSLMGFGRGGRFPRHLDKNTYEAGAVLHGDLVRQAQSGFLEKRL